MTTYDKRACEILASDHDSPTVQALAAQIIALHAAAESALNTMGVIDDIDKNALDDALLVAHREYHELCAECGGEPGEYAGECVTCDDEVRANEPDRTDYE